jgi:hypothetical protein
MGAWELPTYALIATVLQLGVVAWSGFVTYSPHWHEKLDADHANVGFPLVASGTLLLTISMWLCAYIVDEGTVEQTWRRKVLFRISSFRYDLDLLTLDCRKLSRMVMTKVRREIRFLNHQRRKLT